MTSDERAKRIEEALAQDRPWSVVEVLCKLDEAAGILLHGLDYDGHGWELIDAARSHAREHATALRAALALDPAPPREPSEECDYCGGTGYHPGFPPRPGAECRFCGGTGRATKGAGTP